MRQQKCYPLALLCLFFQYSNPALAETPDDIIAFADAEVKRVCVENWDTSGDGELSYAEAQAVTNLGTVFEGNKEIVSFEELQYFTGLKEICSHAFYSCPNLSSVKFPDTITNIASFSMAYCPKLTSIIIPDKVSAIGIWAFGACKLQSVSIPASCEYVGKAAFGYGLESIEVAEDNPVYETRGCSAIIEKATNKLVIGSKSTVIPSSVTSIGDEAMCGCTSSVIPNSVTAIGNQAYASALITSVEIPNSVSVIEDMTFYNCRNLESATLPATIKSIGWAAFNYCTSLVTVTVKMANPLPVSEETFSNRANATLYVPKGSKPAYEATDYWKEFKEIIELNEGPETFSPEDVNRDGKVDIGDILAIINAMKQDN